MNSNAANNTRLYPNQRYFSKAMNRHILTLFALLFAGLSSSRAQRADLYTLESPYQRYTHNLATLRWLGAVPFGSITDGYVDKPSFANYSLSVEWVFRNMPISAGVEAGRYYFEQRYPRSVYVLGQNEVSAVKTSTYTAVPVTGLIKYHFLGTNAQFSPYVQVNIGAHINNYVDYFGLLADQKKQTTLGFGGGAGLKYIFKKDGPVGLDIAVRYDQNTFKYGYITNGVGTLAGSVGLFYRWW